MGSSSLAKPFSVLALPVRFHCISILREINLAFFFYKAECNSDALVKWGIILCLLSKCIIWGTRNTKIEVESLFTEQTCVGFVPMGSNKQKMS